MQKVQSFITNFKSVLAILVAGLVVFGVILSRVIPVVTNIINTDKDFQSAQTSLEDKQRAVENLKEKSKEEQQDAKGQLKAFYRPIEQGLDSEAVIAGEFAEILTVMRNYSVKTKSIKYEYDPQDDNFVKNAADKYNVAKLDAEMIATYKNFESFLKELYKHEHFIDISSFEIVPYAKDKKILVIKFQMKLYAQK